MKFVVVVEDKQIKGFGLAATVIGTENRQGAFGVKMNI